MAWQVWYKLFLNDTLQVNSSICYHNCHTETCICVICFIRVILCVFHRTSLLYVYTCVDNKTIPIVNATVTHTHDQIPKVMRSNVIKDRTIWYWPTGFTITITIKITSIEDHKFENYFMWTETNIWIMLYLFLYLLF